MRSLTIDQASSLSRQYRSTHLKVEIDRSGSGDWVDLRNLNGIDWVIGASWQEAVDDPTMSADVSLRRRFERLSLVTLDDDSALNQSGTIVDAGKRIKISINTVGLDYPATITAWVLVFDGFIDEVDWSSDPIKLRCRDKSSDLVDRFIETQVAYPEPPATSIAVQNLMQDIIDDNDPALDVIAASYVWNGTTTITTADTSEVAAGDYIGFRRAPYFKIASIVPNVSIAILNPSARTIPTGSGTTETIKIPTANRTTLFSVNGTDLTPFVLGDAPGWNIKPYAQSKQHLFEALRTLSDQIGWEIRFVWRSLTSRFDLTFYEPDRAKTAPDWAFDADKYHAITKIAVRRHTIRNIVKVVYQFNNMPASVVQQDIVSIAKYGRRYMEICEGSSSQIDTSTEANKMATAALADLKDPTVEKACEAPMFWPAQLGDLYRFTANGVHYSTDQDLAVTAINHTVERDKARTVFELRGKPAGGFRRWLEIESRLGVGRANDQFAPNTPANVQTENTPGCVVVIYDDPRTMSPPINDWLYTDCHVSLGSGFTPGPTTLKARSRTTRFEIGGLVPGSTYYIKLVIVDVKGNESTVSTEVTAISRKVAPYDVDTNQEWDTANLNSNFSIYTFDKNTTPPDHWFMGGNAVWGTANQQFYWSALTRSANLSLLYNGEIMPAVPVPQVARFVRSEPFVVAEDWLHVVEFLWRHDGNTGNRTTWVPWVYFYAADKVTLVGAPQQPRYTRWNYSSATPLTLAANTWWQDRGWVTPPSGARYARLMIAVYIDDGFGQVRHPALIWDFFSCSRTLGKLIVEGGASNRSIAGGVWVRPFLNNGGVSVLDNEAAFVPGSPSPVLIEHAYVVQRPGEFALFGRIAFVNMTNGAYIFARLLRNGAQLTSSQFQYSNSNSQATWIDVMTASAQLAAGDIITIEGRHTSSPARFLDDSNCRLSITQLTNAKG